MNNIEAAKIEVDRKRDSIKQDYRRSQEGLGGLRRTFGSTLIALGSRIHGGSDTKRDERAERQDATNLRKAA